MKAIPSHEERFIAEVDSFAFLERDLQRLLRRLDGWLEHLNDDLRAHCLTWTGLNENGTLAKQADAINAMLRTNMAAWAEQWNDKAPAQALADVFDDKVILLVFGKFNSGKSSFCNFVADRFLRRNRPVGYFYLDAGRILHTFTRLKEGVTETTARIQGVQLADKLVLIDTPGLHSVTLENAAMTQRFSNSADGVLWLTSSASPGQVQELNELSRELRRSKPLLPVVTRSDCYEEDEIDNELVKHLRNKTTQNRALQEADVTARAAEKLVAMGGVVSQLQPPVSISVYMARELGQTPTAMEEAGFDRLYAGLLAMTKPALSYKRRKSAETLLRHLEEDVLGTLHDQVVPMLAKIDAVSQSALEELVQRRERIIDAVWRSVVPALPELLQKHSTTCDVKAICCSLSQSLFTEFTSAAREHLADYTYSMDESLAKIDLDENASFDDLVVEDDDLRRVVGTDYSRLYSELYKQLRSQLFQLADFAAEQCRLSIAQLAGSAAHLKCILTAREKQILGVKSEIRIDAA